MSVKLRMQHEAFPDGVTRDGLVEWYHAIRRRSRSLFDLVSPDAYYDRPILQRNPIVFYEGHLAGFAVNTLLKLALRLPGIDAELEVLFARGIDPSLEDAAKLGGGVWPPRTEVLAYVAAADAAVERALREAPLDDERFVHLRGGEAVFTILEHEVMHQETFLYMLHNLPVSSKRIPGGLPPPAAAAPPPRRERVRVPAGRVTLGTQSGVFGWDNEFPSFEARVGAFEIDAFNVTNGDYLAYVEATGAPAPHFWTQERGEWMWRGMFGSVPLPLHAPVYVTHEEALACARWMGGRLPTEAEYHRAAFGTPSDLERKFPWGDEPPDASRGCFDFAAWDPVAVGSHPAGASAWGVHDLVGNGWEWTASAFGGFRGFEAMPSYPQYSADFFDDAHFVMKGASPATGRHLLRRGLRNWFRPDYPYVYATFRCVR